MRTAQLICFIFTLQLNVFYGTILLMNNLLWRFLFLASLAALVPACQQTSTEPPTRHLRGAVFEATEYPSGLIYYPTEANLTAYDANGHVLASSEAEGFFDLEINGIRPRERVLVVAEKSYGALTVRNETWTTVPEQGDSIQVPDLALLPPDLGELYPGPEEWTSFDGAVAVAADSVPGNVVRIQALALDPERDRALFPGDFSEARGYELASAGFLQIRMYDAAGNQVQSGSAPAKVRFKLSQGQAGFLFDLRPGSGVYEVPLYVYDEGASTWVRVGEGRLVDEDGQPIPETAEDAILDGAYPGPLYIETDYGVRPSRLAANSIGSGSARVLEEGEYYFTDALNCDVPLVPCDELDSETQGCEALEGGQR